MASFNRRERKNTEKKRSYLLDELYRSPEISNLQLNDIASKVMEFSTDRKGSRFIQRKLDEATQHRKDGVFREIKPYLLFLMKHPFGNFVIQKMFDVGNHLHRTEMIMLISQNFLDLSINQYGCRVVQRVIEKCNDAAQRIMLQLLDRNSVLQMAQDRNANHVIHKIFSCISFKDEFYMNFYRQIRNLSIDLYGSRVIQWMLSHGTEKIRYQIINELREHSLELVKHRYANYTFSQALEYCSQDDCNQLCSVLMDNVFSLSLHKYASNVIEKCLERTCPYNIEVVWLKLLAMDADQLVSLCINPFANYVIQKLIQRGSRDNLIELKKRILPVSLIIRRHVSGRVIMAAIFERIAKPHTN